MGDCCGKMATVAGKPNPNDTKRQYVVTGTVKWGCLATRLRSGGRVATNRGGTKYTGACNMAREAVVLYTPAAAAT